MKSDKSGERRGEEALGQMKPTSAVLNTRTRSQ